MYTLWVGLAETSQHTVLSAANVISSDVQAVYFHKTHASKELYSYNSVGLCKFL